MNKWCRFCNTEIRKEPIVSFQYTNKLSRDGKPNISLDKPDLYQCEFCGLVQIFEKMDESHMDGEIMGEISNERLQFRKKQFHEFVSKHKLHSRPIIEIGAGQGDRMKIMEENMVTVFGIENNKNAARRGNKNGMEIMEGEINSDDYYISGAPYSAFYMLNYLQKSDDPNILIRGICHNLSNEAYGIIEVPDYNNLMNKSLSEGVKRKNLCYYTMDTLANLLSVNGFEIIDIQNIFRGEVICAEVKKRVIPKTKII